MGGVSGVGGSGFYESYESQPSQNQKLIDAKAILNRLTEEFDPWRAQSDLNQALDKLNGALKDPTLTPEQREHTVNAIESLLEAVNHVSKFELFWNNVVEAQNEVNLALEV